MMTNISSDWAVLVIVLGFLSFIVYAIIHGRLQQKKSKEEQNQGNNKK